LSLGKQQAYYGEVKFQSAKSDLWNRSSSAWLDLLAAKSAVIAYEKAISTLAESAKQERIRFEKGDGTKDNMVEAQAQLYQAKAWLEDAQLNFNAKVKAIKLLTGIENVDLSAVRLPQEHQLNFKAEDKSQIWERILSGSPELLAAKAIEQINQLKIDQSFYDQLPTLDVYGQASRAQNDTTNTLGYHYQNQQVGVQMSLPLYSGGGLEATKRQAVASYEASVADRESLEMRIEAQFESDWATQAGLLEKAMAARSLVLSGQEQKRAAELGLQKGQRTWTDVGNSEMLLSRRLSDLINIQLNLFKIQARILSLLPSDDPAWTQWIQQLDVASVQ
jgi:protease secretion system outer membrane protein